MALWMVVSILIFRHLLLVVLMTGLFFLSALDVLVQPPYAFFGYWGFGNRELAYVI